MTVAVLVADWAGAGAQIALNLPDAAVCTLLQGARFVPAVGQAVPFIHEDYVCLADGSGCFPPGRWIDDAINHLSHAGVSAVTFALPGIETYGDLVPSGVMVKTRWLRDHPLHSELQSFGWERLLTIHCSVVVTSRFEMVPVNNRDRQLALGKAYYDQIRDNEIVERLCEP